MSFVRFLVISQLSSLAFIELAAWAGGLPFFNNDLSDVVYLVLLGYAMLAVAIAAIAAAVVTVPAVIVTRRRISRRLAIIAILVSIVTAADLIAQLLYYL